MMREWKPGDVARFVGRNVDTIVFRYADRDAESDEWMCATEGGGYPRPDELRPLVVIDPEDREQVERLEGLLVQNARHEGRACYSASCRADNLTDALRQFADPKPVEPTGLGAVVEDAEGDEWVHLGNGCWIKTVPNAGLRTKSWSDLNAVRVLFEGVQS